MNQILDSVRVRFAPSPTGHLHIGGLRTALFNWLFAQHYNGIFLLRIEDTDRERSKQEYLDSILESMRWLGLEPDEPLVIQSARLEEHKKVIASLVEQGKAYRCFCPAQQIQELKEELMAAGKLLKYDGRCRTKHVNADDLKQPFVVRFKVPYDQATLAFNDLVHGTITFDLEQLEDFIIARSDGTPMYNFVVVVDDAHMKITHIIRGEEHILNTPKQILLYQACGYTLPQFAHIPLILGPSGEKLSKRDGAVSVIEYRKEGYLAEALFNYLVRLGWSHGDQELFTKDELIAFFSLEHVGKKGSSFDQKKLDWVNMVYMRATPERQLLSMIIWSIDPQFYALPFDESVLLMLIAAYKGRVKTLGELVREIKALAQRPQVWSEEEIHTIITVQTIPYLQELIQLLTSEASFTADKLAVLVKSWCNQVSIKLMEIAQPIRLALTGKTASPGVFELLAALGKQESIHRLTVFLQLLMMRSKT
jgi:glutamyl-tRNA synthetase